MQKTDNVALFLAGAGIGLAASLLLAPDAGGKTRRRIRDAANRAGDILKNRAKDASAASNEVLDDYGLTRKEIRKRVSDLQAKARAKAGDATDAAKSAAKQAVDKANDVAEKIEESGHRLQEA